EIREVENEKTVKEEEVMAFKEDNENKQLKEEPLSILFIFKNIEGITPKALIEDMKSFPYIKKIHKCAIVADNTFTKVDETISKFIPGVQVKHFELEEINDAKEWLTHD